MLSIKFILEPNLAGFKVTPDLFQCPALSTTVTDMCGRTRCAVQPSRLKKQLGISKWVDEREFKPSYNIGPGFWLPTICSTTHGTELRSMKWGLVPSFTKPASEPDHFKMFNCRSDTMHEKPSFRRLVGRNQCLVVIEGFYEWRKEHKHGKQPYFIHLKSDGDDNKIQLMMLAGLYDTWKDSNGQVSLTCTILTTEADDQLSWLHDRMPVILATKEDQNKWLNMSPEFRFVSLSCYYDIVWESLMLIMFYLGCLLNMQGLLDNIWLQGI